MSQSKPLFNLENVEPRTYIVFAILIIFTLGMISIILTPEEEQFYETVSTKEEPTPSDGASSKASETSNDDDKEEEVVEPKKTPVKTPTKKSRKKSEVTSVEKRTMSGRKVKKPVYYEPGSPGGN